MRIQGCSLVVAGALLSIELVHSFSQTSFGRDRSSLSSLYATKQGKLSPLPKDISPFEKSASKSRDVQGEFRKIAKIAIERALDDDVKLLEIEFPPLLGGDQSKSQFDDFDNVQELNHNRDWCIQSAPDLAASISKRGPIWFILPDLKEVELAKDEWTGERYRKASRFSSIEAVTDHYSSTGEKDGSYAKPWGATLASGVSSLLGGGKDAGLLGDQSALDDLTGDTPALHMVCQPGNGGPVEDWVNVEALHKNADASSATMVVNGALDKVRDGYYAPFIFPKLAKTFPFYRSFEAVFFLKPISDKGVYGWLYKVYPEPWQLYLQKPYQKNGQMYVEDKVALVSDTRPVYAECVQALLAKASEEQ